MQLRNLRLAENTSPGAKQIPSSSASSNKARESKGLDSSSHKTKPPVGRLTFVPAGKLASTARAMRALRRHAPVIELGAPEYCLFDTMDDFQTQFLLERK